MIPTALFMRKFPLSDKLSGLWKLQEKMKIFLGRNRIDSMQIYTDTDYQHRQESLRSIKNSPFITDDSKIIKLTQEAVSSLLNLKVFCNPVKTPIHGITQMNKIIDSPEKEWNTKNEIHHKLSTVLSDTKQIIQKEEKTMLNEKLLISDNTHKFTEVKEKIFLHEKKSERITPHKFVHGKEADKVISKIFSHQKESEKLKSNIFRQGVEFEKIYQIMPIRSDNENVANPVNKVDIQTQTTSNIWDEIKEVGINSLNSVSDHVRKIVSGFDVFGRASKNVFEDKMQLQTDQGSFVEEMGWTQPYQEIEKSMVFMREPVLQSIDRTAETINFVPETEKLNSIFAELTKGLKFSDKSVKQDTQPVNEFLPFSQGNNSGKTMYIDRFCDQFVVHITQADRKGYEQLQEEIKESLLKIFESYD